MSLFSHSNTSGLDFNVHHLSVDYFQPQDLPNVKYDSWNFTSMLRSGILELASSACLPACLQESLFFVLLRKEIFFSSSLSLLCEGVISPKSLNTWLKDKMKRSVPPL